MGNPLLDLERQGDQLFDEGVRLFADVFDKLLASTQQRLGR